MPNLADQTPRYAIVLLSSRGDGDLVEPLCESGGSFGLTGHSQMQGLEGTEHQPGLKGSHHRTEVGSVNVQLQSMAW